MRSEVYPHLRSTVRAVSADAESGSSSRSSTSGGIDDGGRRRSLPGTAPLDEPSAAAAGAAGSMEAVEDIISFPALRGPAATVRSHATQTSDDGSSGGVMSRHAGPGPVLARFQQPLSSSARSSPNAAAADEEEFSLLDPPRELGLRRRGRSASGTPASFAAAPPTASTPASRPSTLLPEQGRPTAPPGADAFSVVSAGSVNGA